MIKRHTVLLGAGATMAAIPNGDKNGQKSYEQFVFRAWNGLHPKEC